MSRLANKTTIVTAAAQGIGRATALAFAREGARVVACDINAAGLDALAAEARVETRVLDARSTDAIARLAADVPAPDVLFNCVGYVHNGTILECDDEAFDRSFDINVKSMFRLIRALLPGMVAAGRGSIINISSVASSVIAVPNRFVYGASKAAVIGLTKSVALDFVAKGIRANAICPGTVESPSLQDRMRATGDFDAARASFIARQPMGRLGTPEEIANLAVYLASDESSFVTGGTFVIDGGWTNA
ncbi:MAG TPA: SDR family oxidoreductase [Vicinamibacterales bacterium]|jgi:2-keto-3-deoxy-L-fuconate dehydrogenase|nr:SDR family oxidoreductase [Vicinamibacterales bacterium]